MMKFKVIIENDNYVAIPAKLVDYFIRLANGDQLKVLLFIARNHKSDMTIQQIAASTSLSEGTVADAIGFLKSINIITEDDNTEAPIAYSAITKPDQVSNIPVTSEDFVEVVRKKYSFRHKFSAKESEIVKNWFLKGISVDLAVYAYAETLLRIDSPNITYIDKILTSWLSEKKTTVEAVALSESNIKKEKKAEIVSKCSNL